MWYESAKEFGEAMGVTEQLVEEILKIHDSEFQHYDLFFRQAAYYYNCGKWYWPKYFYASLDMLGFWTFQICGTYIHNDKLVEKFDRIWGSRCSEIHRQDEVKEEQRLQKILTSLKRKNQ